MGHRALLARERPDGRYDCYYAHWGGQDLSLARRLDDPNSPGIPNPAVDPAVDDYPLAVDVPREAVFDERLDPLAHEALFVVHSEGVDAYRPLWFGPVEGAAVVAVDPYDPCDDDRVLAWFHGTRDAVADLLADGAIDAETAVTCLRRRVRAWADGREVMFV